MQGSTTCAILVLGTVFEGRLDATHTAPREVHEADPQPTGLAIEERPLHRTHEALARNTHTRVPTVAVHSEFLQTAQMRRPFRKTLGSGSSRNRTADLRKPP